MPKYKKGVALFMVLATVLISVILAGVVLNIITSQNRLTQHKVDHIRAYYAAQAGMVYAIEMLRKGSWTYPGSCPNNAPCSLPASETDPYLTRVRIVLCPSGNICGTTMTTACTPPVGYNFCVTTLFDYP